LEQTLKDSGISYAILRPAVLFGDQGILINNIAWFLRRFPIFPVPGNGEYRLQPILAQDLAELAVQYGGRTDDVTIDAVGPETYTFNELLSLIKNVIHSRARIIHVNPSLALMSVGILNHIVQDVIMTPDEVKGLHANLLISAQSPTAPTRLSDWLSQNAHWLGVKYMSELKKHYKTSPKSPPCDKI